MRFRLLLALALAHVVAAEEARPITADEAEAAVRALYAQLDGVRDKDERCRIAEPLVTRLDVAAGCQTNPDQHRRLVMQARSAELCAVLPVLSSGDREQLERGLRVLIDDDERAREMLRKSEAARHALEQQVQALKLVTEEQQSQIAEQKRQLQALSAQLGQPKR